MHGVHMRSKFWCKLEFAHGHAHTYARTHVRMYTCASLWRCRIVRVASCLAAMAFSVAPSAAAEAYAEKYSLPAVGKASFDIAGKQ